MIEECFKSANVRIEVTPLGDQPAESGIHEIPADEFNPLSPDERRTPQEVEPPRMRGRAPTRRTSITRRKRRNQR